QVSPPGSLRRAVELLNQARRPVLLVGSQSTLGVADLHALRKALEDLGLPVYLSGMARGLMGKRHPLFYRHQRRQALREADLVILAGVPADFRLNYGRSISSKAVVIGVNRSRADLRLNRKPELGVLADPGTFLRDLAALSSQGQWRREDWLAQLTQREQEREAAIEGESAPAPSGINPVRLLRKLDSLLGENCILIGDGGDFVGTASYTVSPRGPLSWLDPGVFGTLGVGAGFALGAKLARPDAEVWALFGDGSVGYSLSEWDTFARHGVAVGALIGNDGSWNQIARDQVTLLKDDVGTVLRQSDYHEVARALGAQGLVLRAEEEVTPGLKHARELLRQGHPVLVNALCVRSGFREGSISI
ncbi:MAG: thiamine pyrophosphate-dependent enzyme, partial [Deltaproteobacteria bacterium]|nr:thiamine pyrophosphate-dependent enzyme [Deltaproteobacteria bacterium]